MKKVLIIGPFGDFGGRELEAGFLAKTLGESYDVSLCSTVMMSPGSQVFEFMDRSQGFSVLEKVYKKHALIRLMAGFSKLKDGTKRPAYAFVKNGLNKRFLNVKRKLVDQLLGEVARADLLLICAQLSSEYIPGIVAEAELLQKPILFRTTGTIRAAHLRLLYLRQVDLFVHHSKRNASLMSAYPHSVVDQPCFSEATLLNIPITPKTVQNFTFLGRISDEKGTVELIKLFTKHASRSHRLNVYGEGPLEIAARRIAPKDLRIKFHGFVEQQGLEEVFSKTDCLIIPSKEEAGPLSGLEAMAAGKLILSTDVGAMKERLEGTGNDFWFELEDETTFAGQLERISTLEPSAMEAIGNANRSRYREAYTMAQIRKQYKACVDGLF